MPYLIKVGETDNELRSIEFTLRSTVDGGILTGQSNAVTIRIRQGGVEVEGVGTVVEPDPTHRPGLYQYRLASTEVASAAPVLIRPVMAGAYPADWPCLVVPDSPYEASATSGEVAGAVWNESISGHSVNGSFGQLLSSLGAPLELAPEERDALASAIRDVNLLGAAEGGLGSAVSLLHELTNAIRERTDLIPDEPAVAGPVGLTAEARELVAEAVNDTSVTGTVTGVPSSGNFTGVGLFALAPNAYNRAYLVFSSGALHGVARRISSSTTTGGGANCILNFAGQTGAMDEAFPLPPAVGDTFRIIGRG